MKTRKNKPTIFLLFLMTIIVAIGCNDSKAVDDDMEPDNMEPDDMELYDEIFNRLSCTPTSVTTGEKGDITGYWKLVKDEKTMTEDGLGRIEPFPYDCYYVIYNFHTDNELIITSDIEKHSPQGKLEYKISKPSNSNSSTSVVYFNDRKWFATIAETRMILVDSDDPEKRLFFVRVNEDEHYIEDTEARKKLEGEWYLIFKGYDDTNYLSGEISDDNFIVFRPDGTIREYIQYPNEYIEKFTYRINSTYYYKHIMNVSEQSSGNGRWVYTYNFYDDKFKIDIKSGLVTLYDTYIYQRKK